MEELKNIFKKEYKKDIDDKEAFEISSKLTNFFELLLTIEARDNLPQAKPVVASFGQKQTSFDNFYG